MKLEIDSVHRVSKFIRVSCMNIDTHLILQIPIQEYIEWLRVNDYKNSIEFQDARFRDFVDEYLTGIINHDSTANMLLERIAGFVGTGDFPVRYGTETRFYTLSCSVKYKNYSIVDSNGRPLTHKEIINIYDIFMKSFGSLSEGFSSN